jgi:hypothetical protein
MQRSLCGGDKNKWVNFYGPSLSFLDGKTCRPGKNTVYRPGPFSYQWLCLAEYAHMGYRKLASNNGDTINTQKGMAHGTIEC